jgi:hypothetical protein
LWIIRRVGEIKRIKENNEKNIIIKNLFISLLFLKKIKLSLRSKKRDKKTKEQSTI